MKIRISRSILLPDRSPNVAKSDDDPPKNDSEEDFDQIFTERKEESDRENDGDSEFEQ